MATRYTRKDRQRLSVSTKSYISLPPISLYLYVPRLDRWIRKRGREHTQLLRSTYIETPDGRLIKKSMYEKDPDIHERVQRPSKRAREMLRILLNTRDVLKLVLMSAILSRNHRCADILPCYSDLSTYAYLRMSCKLFGRILNTPEMLDTVVRYSCFGCNLLMYVPFYRAAPRIQKLFLKHHPIHVMLTALSKKSIKRILYTHLGFDQSLRDLYRDRFFEKMGAHSIKLNTCILVVLGSFFTFTEEQRNNIVELAMVDNVVGRMLLGDAIDMFCYD